MYAGIQFHCKTTVMKDISDQLEGKNFNTYDENQLFNAFSSTIEIINSK